MRSQLSDRVDHHDKAVVFVCLVFIFSTIMNDNFKMNNNEYSENDLHLMSYQDLRRLSNLLRLPANIKKKYMISMIQAHQKGDGCMKTAIANKIMEERKVKRLTNKKKQSKSYIMSSSANNEQIPTDLSVSAQHEFETRFSYVAHYSKDEIGSRISRIIKQEAEVSRRNRSILQQSRKPTRKLSTVGRTEIMLPRNHSLTTPVRLMPQYERGFPPPIDYGAAPGVSSAENHCQDLSFNYNFHEEFSNALLPTTTHELYKAEPSWHTREVYNNTLMPILNSLLTSSSLTINPHSYPSQYTSSSSLKGSTSFQGVYENYIKSNGILESQAFQSDITNSSTLIVSKHHMMNDSCSNTYNVTRGNYLYTKGDVEVEITSTTSEIKCQHCNKRGDPATKNSNENQGFLDFYAPRNPESTVTPEASHITNIKDLQQYNNDCFRTESQEMPLPIPHRSFEPSPLIAYRTTEIVETEASDHETIPPVVDDYDSNYLEEGKLWEESENGLKKLMGRNRTEKENLADCFLTSQSQGSILSEVSGALTNFSNEAEFNDKLSKTREEILRGKEILSYVPHFSRCRYTLGHDKYPEAASNPNQITTLPSFPSVFSSNELYNKAYSVCKNSFTETTETHLNPIMTCTYATQFSSHTNPETQVNNTSNGAQIQRQWYLTYPEPPAPYSLDSATYTTWNEYSSEMDNKMIAQNNSHNLQVVKCRTHGRHYLYSISNP